MEKKYLIKKDGLVGVFTLCQGAQKILVGVTNRIQQAKVMNLSGYTDTETTQKFTDVAREVRSSFEFLAGFAQNPIIFNDSDIQQVSGVLNKLQNTLKGLKGNPCLPDMEFSMLLSATENVLSQLNANLVVITPDTDTKGYTDINAPVHVEPPKPQETMFSMTGGRDEGYAFGNSAYGGVDNTLGGNVGSQLPTSVETTPQIQGLFGGVGVQAGNTVPQMQEFPFSDMSSDTPSIDFMKRVKTEALKSDGGDEMTEQVAHKSEHTTLADGTLYSVEEIQKLMTGAFQSQQVLRDMERMLEAAKVRAIAASNQVMRQKLQMFSQVLEACKSVTNGELPQLWMELKH